MIYTFANCELDTDLLELRRDGVLQSVEPQVFEVLAYLLAHRDRVVAREELLAQVWGHTYVSDAALTGRLKEARKVVGDDGRAQSLIRTVRGRGYRFVGEVRQREARGPAGAKPSRAAPPIAGRDSERARLGELLEAASAGRRQVVVVTGEAGIGKTTLIEAFLADATADADVLMGRGHCIDQQEAVEPYMPVLEALADIGSDPDGERVVDTLARIAPTWLVQMPWLADDATLADARDRALGARPERMLREMAQALETLCADTPVLVVLDDLHWADRATLRLVEHLARARGPARLFLLGAARPSHGSPIEALLRELRPRGLCLELELPLLAADAIADYVAERFPGVEPAGLALALRERTDGNPLFMDCVVGSWMEMQTLVKRDGEWALHGDPELVADEIPDTLRGLIEQDVERLDAEDRGALEAASAVGLVFSAGTVAAAAGLSEEAAEARLVQLARAGRLIEEREPLEWPDGVLSAAFGFHHDLHRQVLYESLPGARRFRVHRDIAAWLESAYGRSAAEHSAELAAHYLAGGSADAAVRYLGLAAEQASSRGAPHEAEAHLRRALGLIERGESVTDAGRREMALRADLATALVALEGYSSIEAQREYERALELARSRGDAAFTSRLLYLFAGMHELRAEYAESEALLEESLRTDPEPDPGRLVETHELMACSLFHQGRFEAAVKHAELGLSEFEPEQRHPIPAFEGEHPAIGCNDWAGLALWCLGKPEQARARIRSALELASGEDWAHGLAFAHLFAAHLHHLRRDPQAARGHAEAALAEASEGRIAYQMAVARILLGWSMCETGEPEEGRRLVRLGLEDHAATGARMDRPYFLGLLSRASTLSGRADEALAAAEEALDLLSDDRPFFYEPELHRLRAVALLEARGPDAYADAEAALRRGLSVAREQGTPALELRLTVTLARLLSDRGAPVEARSVLQAAGSGLQQDADSADAREAQELLAGLP